MAYQQNIHAVAEILHPCGSESMEEGFADGSLITLMQREHTAILTTPAWTNQHSGPIPAGAGEQKKLPAQVRVLWCSGPNI